MSRAFTLIELLVVVAIILVLLALLIPVVGMARTQARIMATGQRIEDVLRSLGEVSGGDPSSTAAYVLHKALLARSVADPVRMPGATDFVMTYAAGGAATMQTPAAGQSWIPAPYPAFCFEHPWGRVPTEFADDASTTLPAPGDPVPVEAHALGDLSPAFTIHLLDLAGLLPPAGASAYYGDRSPGRAWNDAWGRPLVLGLGLYQPRRNTTVAITEAVHYQGNQNNVYAGFIRDDLFLKRAREAYGYTRSLYLTAAASGPRLPIGLDPALLESQSPGDWNASGTGTLYRLWNAIDSACNRDPSDAPLWATDGAGRNPWTEPPWTGVRCQRRDGGIWLLGAPVEVR